MHSLSKAQITDYPPGSIREVAAVSFPLILTAASGSIMHFFDRSFLAQYDLHAMNVAIATYMPVATLQFSAIAIASIAEVFVGKYNGAGRTQQLGWPVWQMVYFSLLTALIFIPCAWIGLEGFVPEMYRAEGKDYLFWSLLSGPFFPLSAALCCFFIGRGKVWTVAIATLLANALNAGLARMLIFGVAGWIPSMGLNGAPIATGIAIVVECIFLFILFLSKTHRTHYHTHDARFRWGIFWDCLRIGIPNSLGHLVEMIGWSIILYTVSQSSPTHATLYGVCHTLFFLLFCFIEGLHKGVIALVANAMGAERLDLIRKIVFASFKLCVILVSTIGAILWLSPQMILQFFFDANTPSELITLTITGVSLLSIGFFFDALAWIFAGILTAASDTRFVMATAIWTTWIVGVAPIYFLLHQIETPLFPNYIWILTAIAAAICNGWRYLRSPWMKANRVKGA
jgi:MATE family multidrug resistance protein